MRARVAEPVEFLVSKTSSNSIVGELNVSGSGACEALPVGHAKSGSIRPRSTVWSAMRKKVHARVVQPWGMFPRFQIECSTTELSPHEWWSELDSNQRQLECVCGCTDWACEDRSRSRTMKKPPRRVSGGSVPARGRTTEPLRRGLLTETSGNRQDRVRALCGKTHVESRSTAQTRGRQGRLVRFFARIETGTTTTARSLRAPLETHTGSRPSVHPLAGSRGDDSDRMSSTRDGLRTAASLPPMPDAHPSFGPW